MHLLLGYSLNFGANDFSKYKKSFRETDESKIYFSKKTLFFYYSLQTQKKQTCFPLLCTKTVFTYLAGEDNTPISLLSFNIWLNILEFACLHL